MQKAWLAVVLLLLASGMSYSLPPTPGDWPVHQLNLMPAPATVQVLPGRLQLGSRLTIAVQGPSDSRVERALGRMVRRLQVHTITQIAYEVAPADWPATLVVSYSRGSKPFPELGDDESYALEVTPQRAVLKAKAATGVLRALETFLQLVESDTDGYFLPAVNIQDRPRFPWRGLLIDVSRHYQPVEAIKRNLDAMSAVKMNVFHWHLTDDQGFRIESRQFPALYQMGSDGLYYTQGEAREIIDYAADRGIRVVPEFDMPGHSTAWFVGRPELASGPGPYVIERKFGIFDPVMDPTRESTYEFLDKFIGEMAKLFPDAYMHIGGDENNGKQWSQNPLIQAFMKSRKIADTQALQTYFNQRLLKILQKHGKKMVGWDEILHPDLPKDVVVQSWRGQDSLAQGARQGFNGILSAPYYLDHFETAEFHYRADPLPANTDLTADQAQRILGGEACAWGEFLSPQSIDSRIWPRAAAIAERFWSPREMTDVDDMYRRLAVLSSELEEMGLIHLAHGQRVLRQFAAQSDFRSLATVAGALAPVGFSARFDQKEDSQLTPLNRLADALHPEPFSTRQFSALVDRLLSDAPRFVAGRAELTQLFTAWRDASLTIAPGAGDSPVLRDARSRAPELSELGTTGLETLTFLQSGTPPSAEWQSQKLALLAEAAKPKSLLRFPWLPSFRLLVMGTMRVDQLKSTAPQQWKQAILGAAVADRKE
jgi:hexosaminidase